MMKACRVLLVPLSIAALLGQGAAAQTPASASLTEREAKMFSMSASYETFMGRWSRRVAPLCVAFVGVKSGDRVLDVGTGTGVLCPSASMSLTCDSKN